MHYFGGKDKLHKIIMLNMAIHFTEYLPDNSNVFVLHKNHYFHFPK